MTIDELDRICGALPHAGRVVQWRGMHVWKVGGKMFALCDGTARGVPVCPWFKVSDLAWPILTEQPGLRPAPYLARARWVALDRPDALADGDLAAYLAEAHRVIVAGLSKRVRRELGL